MIERCAVVESLPALREYVEQCAGAAGLDEPARFALVLATDEACSNIVEHGYEAGTAGSIVIEFARDDQRATITIRDRGRPFRPDDAPAPDVESAWDERPLGGLGWHLIRSVVDEVHYETDSVAGNRLTLVKHLAGRVEGES